MSAQTNGFPDFYIVGPQKTGTTWLVVQLLTHPQVWSSTIKEVMYFDSWLHGTTPPWIKEHRQTSFAGALARWQNKSSPEASLWTEDYINKLCEQLSAGEVTVTDKWYASFSRGGRPISFASTPRRLIRRCRVGARTYEVAVAQR